MSKCILSLIDLPEAVRRELSARSELYIRGELSERQLDEVLARANVIIAGQLNEELLSKAGRLEMIQMLTAGLDHVPFKAIPEKVIVCSNSGANADAVAESAMAMVLALAKNVVHHQQNMCKGIWDQSRKSLLLRGKVMGILGLGEIGKRIHRMARSLGMRVYAINRSGRSDLDCDFVGTLQDIRKVLGEADVVVVCMGLTKFTRHLIGREELSCMKANAILVNVGRADLIVKDDLERHLAANPEFKVGLDVWWNPNRFILDAGFMRFENLLGMPWVAGGYGNDEVFEEMKAMAVRNVLRYLDGQTPLNLARREDFI